LGRTARILSLASSGLHRPLFGTGELEERLPLASEKKIRYLIALHWTKGLLNQIKRYVYSAVDVERN